MKRNQIFLIIIIAVLLQGCLTDQNNSATDLRIEENTKTAKVQATPTPTDPGLEEGILPTETKPPVSVYAPIPVSLEDLDEAGSIWIFDEDSNQFWVYDLTRLGFSYLPLPENCDSYLLPNTTNVLCQEDQYLHIYNLVTGDLISLGVPAGDWVSSSSNGNFLLIGKIQGGTFLDPSWQTITVFDLQNHEIVSNLSLDTSNWYSLAGSLIPGGSPTVSNDGKTLAVLQQGVEDNQNSNGLFIYDLDTSQLSKVDVAPVNIESPVGAGLVWSPTSNSLILGLSERDEIVYWATSIYSYDNQIVPIFIQNTDTHLFFQPFWPKHLWFPFGDMDGVPINLSQPETWSSDGEKLLFVFSEEIRNLTGTSIEEVFGICIITYMTLSTTCYPIFDQGYDGSFIGPNHVIWSSEGSYIAFSATNASAEKSLVIVFDYENEKFFQITDEVEKIGGLYWR